MSARLARTISEARQAVAEARRRGETVGLVPTMGALHAGHARLIDTARRESGCVAVSIFVNPTQFNQASDYERYPRDLDADLDFCATRGVDLVFAPDVKEMYPDNGTSQAFVEVIGVTEHLCGKFRPGHFRGVATVVNKLFNIIQPDHAYFGEKDAQQFAVIRRMVRDLNLPMTVVEVPTVRECDGLALSSRNQLLTPEQRRIAIVLYQALRTAEQRVASGEADAARVRHEAMAVLARQPEVRVEYFEIVDPDGMQSVARIAGPVRVAGAVWLGAVRLIDNMLCDPQGQEGQQGQQGH